MSEPGGAREWERGWDGHAEAQARRMAALSLAEKLDWLEEAHEMVRRMQAQQKTPHEHKDNGGREP